MLTGICPCCNCQCFGLALLDPQHLKCPECGIGQLVVNDNYKPPQGYLRWTPFTAASLDGNLGDKPSARNCAS